MAERQGMGWPREIFTCLGDASRGLVRFEIVVGGWYRSSRLILDKTMLLQVRHAKNITALYPTSITPQMPRGHGICCSSYSLSSPDFRVRYSTAISSFRTILPGLACLSKMLLSSLHSSDFSREICDRLAVTNTVLLRVRLVP